METLNYFRKIMRISLIIHAIFPSLAFTHSIDQLSGTHCPEDNVTSDYGVFEFPLTLGSVEGNIIQASCPYGFLDDGTEPIILQNNNNKDILAKQSGAKRACILVPDKNTGNYHSIWHPQRDITIQYCRSANAFFLVGEVNITIIQPQVITPITFKRAYVYLVRLIQFAFTDLSCAQTLIDSISRMLSETDLFDQYDLRDESLALIGMVEMYSRQINLEPGYRVRLQNSDISVQVARFSYSTKHLTSNTEVTITDYGMEIENVKINLPAEAIRMSLDQGVGPKLSFTAYSEYLFFHWKESNEDIIGYSSTTDPRNTLSSVGNDTTSNLIGNWRVFSVEVVGATIQNLSQEFEYIIYPEQGVHEYLWRCVYWDDIEKKWSTEGMRSIQLGNAVICKSTHLTAFSVLIDPLPLPFPGSDYAPINNSVHSHILKVLSSLGSALSIIGLVGTVLTYGLFRCLRKERSNRILLCLSVSLLGLHLLSISSEKKLWDSKCFIPSILLHYFLHTSLWWMLMEAHHMHQLLISVFVKPESRFLFKRAILAWGVPLIIVSVCASIHPEVYLKGRNDLCVIAAHLNLPLYYIAYLAPAVLILLINLFVFCRIFKVLYKQTMRQSKENRMAKATSQNRNAPSTVKVEWDQTIGKKAAPKTRYVLLSPTQIKGAVTVMILVGVGWTVGLLAIGPFEVFFKYLFCICNAGQGAMIFLFRVVLHPQACRQWKKTILGLTPESGEVSTTSSTSLSLKDKNFSISPTFISASNSVENSLTPSNPVAQDLAKILASMLRSSEGPNKFNAPL